MTRYVVLKLGTTGLDYSSENPDKICEISAIEIISGRIGEQFHHYLKPDHSFSAGASAHNMLKQNDLKNQPLFSDVSDELLTFIGSSPLVVQSRRDLRFLNNELKHLDHSSIDDQQAISVTSLVYQKKIHTGRTPSLEVICTKLRIDIDQSDGVNAKYNCNRLAQAFLRLQQLQLSKRAGLRPRFKTEECTRTASLTPDVAITSTLFLNAKEARQQELAKDEEADNTSRVAL